MTVRRRCVLKNIQGSEFSFRLSKNLSFTLSYKINKAFIKMIFQ